MYILDNEFGAGYAAFLSAKNDVLFGSYFSNYITYNNNLHYCVIAYYFSKCSKQQEFMGTQ